MAEATSLYDAAGGMAFFERLVDTFYAGVASDAVLLPLYPDAPDLRGARHRLTLFLAQYWGGPTTYSDERGHPRLRMRHMPFRIGTAQRDHWLMHMRHAVETCAPTAEVAETLLNYFVPAAEQMRNDTGLPITSSTKHSTQKCQGYGVQSGGRFSMNAARPSSASSDP